VYVPDHVPPYIRVVAAGVAGAVVLLAQDAVEQTQRKITVPRTRLETDRYSTTEPMGRRVASTRPASTILQRLHSGRPARCVGPARRVCYRTCAGKSFKSGELRACVRELSASKLCPSCHIASGRFQRAPLPARNDFTVPYFNCGLGGIAHVCGKDFGGDRPVSRAIRLGGLTTLPKCL